MSSRFFRTALGALAFAAAISPAQAQEKLEARFDNAFGTELREPPSYVAHYENDLERQIAQLADGTKGRIGIAALDLTTGEEIAVLGDQRFPMASTSKIAIAATYLEGVDKGRWSLDDKWPLMVPQRSAPFSSARAPVKPGKYLTALELIDLMITRSSNQATDALIAAVGGTGKVNDWVRRAGIEEFNLSRDIATLVRDDGEFDPVKHIDLRDSATPRAMVRMLAGLHKGEWLSASSRAVLIGAMERCRTGTRRIPALMPADVQVAHKTGSLNNTSSDIGILTAPDGRTIAVAIYVTGQVTKPNREARIAELARAVYDGYQTHNTQWVNARYGR